VRSAARKRSGGKSADTIAADAVKATRDTESLRVSGNTRQPGGNEIGLDFQALLASLDSEKSERKGMKKGETTEIDGRSALALEKKQPGGEKITMYVATEGEPHILKAVTEGGDAPGEVVLSDFDKKVDVQEPAAGDVVDPEKITA